jgi:hypothetical protein
MSINHRSSMARLGSRLMQPKRSAAGKGVGPQKEEWKNSKNKKMSCNVLYLGN